jgi:hypothetical protein
MEPLVFLPIVILILLVLIIYLCIRVWIAQNKIILLKRENEFLEKQLYKLHHGKNYEKQTFKR